MGEILYYLKQENLILINEENKWIADMNGDSVFLIEELEANKDYYLVLWANEGIESEEEYQLFFRFQPDRK